MSRKAKKSAARLGPMTEADLLDLCSHLADGFSLEGWAKPRGRTKQAVRQWITATPERNALYREARRMQADTHIDQLIELADEAVPTDALGRMDSSAVNDKRLRIDTRKWIAAKFHPDLYGDKVAIDANVTTNDKKPADVMAQIVALLASNGLRVLPEQSSDGSSQAG